MCGHLAITYGGELLYLRNFSLLSPPSNFLKHMLPFLCACKHLGYHAVKEGNENENNHIKSVGITTHLHR